MTARTPVATTARFVLAFGPGTVTRPVRCAACDRMCQPGERVATLANGAGTAHLSPCITGLRPADFGPWDD